MAEKYKIGEAPWEKNQGAKEAYKVGQAPWESAQAQIQTPESPAPSEQESPERTSAGEAGLQGFGQGGTLGYLPELQAGLGYGMGKAAEWLGASPAESYNDLLKHYQERNQTLREEHPAATFAGNVAGAVATLPTPGSAAKLGVGAKALRALGTGAAYGALANPETEGITENPYENLKQRLTNALIGGGVGGITEGAVSGVGKYLAKSGARAADQAVVKQIGANAGQVKRILKKDELPKIGEFLSEEGLMRPGKSLDDVAQKTGDIIQSDGPKIGQLYQDAQADAQALQQTVGPNASGAKISGPQLADDIMTKVKSDVKSHPNRDAVLQEMDASLQPLRDMGDNANLTDIHDFRKGLDENIDWSKAARERKAVQDAYVTARNMVSDKANSVLGALDQQMPGDPRVDLLKKLNQRFSAASTVNNIAQQGQAREMVKALMGHGLIGGVAGLGAGGVAYEHTRNPLTAAEVGLGTMLATGLARRYGNPIGYYGGRATSALGRGVGRLAPGGAAAAAPWVNMGPKQIDYGGE